MLGCLGFEFQGALKKAPNLEFPVVAFLMVLTPAPENLGGAANAVAVNAAVGAAAGASRWEAGML